MAPIAARRTATLNQEIMNRLLIAALLLCAATGAHAQTPRTCSGEFTDMRVIGITLGDCDLTWLSDADLDQVKKTCGEPSTIDTYKPPSKCSIKVIASDAK